MELDLFGWKVCSSCTTKKPITDFGRNKAQADGYHYYCRRCVKMKAESNKEKNKAWRKKNRRDKSISTKV
jgi:hypothetical protein